MSLPFDFSYREIAPQVMLWEMTGQPDPVGWGRMLEEGARFLSQLERRGRRMAFVIDPSELCSVDAGLRRDVGQWRVDNMPLIANVVPCASYVAKSAWLRGAITAIFWLAPPIVRVGVRGSRPEALAWVEAELASAALATGH